MKIVNLVTKLPLNELGCSCNLDTIRYYGVAEELQQPAYKYISIRK